MVDFKTQDNLKYAKMGEGGEHERIGQKDGLDVGARLGEW